MAKNRKVEVTFRIVLPDEEKAPVKALTARVRQEAEYVLSAIGGKRVSKVAVTEVNES